MDKSVWAVGVNNILNFKQNEVKHGSLYLKAMPRKAKTLDIELKIKHFSGHIYNPNWFGYLHFLHITNMQLVDGSTIFNFEQNELEHGSLYFQ